MIPDGFSLVTASMGNSFRLRQLWRSISNQESTLWEWIVVAPQPAPAWWPTEDRVNWIQSEPKSVNSARNLGALKARYSYLLFLDDDVTLPSKTHLLKRLAAHQRNPNSVLGGEYHSPKDCSFWDRAYNVLCRLWLKRFQIGPEGEILLGGNFSMETQLFRVHLLLEDAEWGGEETLSFMKWKASGVRLSWQRNLYVEHRPQKSMVEFFRTAWRQGRGKSRTSTQLNPHTMLALLWSAGGWGFILGLYWLVVEAARITAQYSEKTNSEPFFGTPSDNGPAKSTSK